MLTCVAMSKWLLYPNFELAQLVMNSSDETNGFSMVCNILESLQPASKKVGRKTSRFLVGL